MRILLTHFQWLDTYSFLWIQSKLKNSRYLDVVKLFTKTGDGWLYGMVIFCLLFIDIQQNFTFFVCCVLSYSVAVPLYVYLKKQFKRNRPQQYLYDFEANIKAPDDFSFPSGHTASAFVMSFQILMFFPQYFVLSFFYALAIGISRILLGVHFPGDVIAGAIIGIFCSIFSYLMIV